MTTSFAHVAFRAPCAADQLANDCRASADGGQLACNVLFAEVAQVMDDIFPPSLASSVTVDRLRCAA